MILVVIARAGRQTMLVLVQAIGKGYKNKNCYICPMDHSNIHFFIASFLYAMKRVGEPEIALLKLSLLRRAVEGN